MANQDNITIALKSEASRKRRRALRLLAAVAALALVGSAKAQEDHPGNACAEMAGDAPSPVAARAAMLVASADNPQKPIVSLGSTVWSLIRRRQTNRQPLE